MSDLLDTIDHQNNPLDGKVFAAPSGSALTIRPAGERTRLSLRIAQKDREKASKAFGQDIPARIGEMSSNNQRSALCLGPDEWLLLAPDGERAQILAQFAALDGVVPFSLTDVGHRTVGIEISGPGATLTLNSGCPLDLDEIPVGNCTRTILDKAQIILLKLDEEHYRLEIVRSFVPYVWEYLSLAASEIG